jgi:diacylglycerol kinase (ATP)
VSAPTRTDEPTTFVLNPQAGAGRAGRAIDQLKRAIDSRFQAWDLRVTEGPGHATELAAGAAAQGARLVVAVGGDGTCHEVVNGLAPAGRADPAAAAFSLLPAGTGSDLQRSLKIPHDLAGALRVIAEGPTRAVDVGDAELVGPEGPRREAFINVAGFGMNGAVVRKANQMDKRMGGAATFFLASIRTTFQYEAPLVELRWTTPEGQQHTREMPVLSCFLANGGWCGGGMWVGRGGSLHDGALDVTILPPSPIAHQVLQSRRLYSGDLEGWPGARRLRAVRFEARTVDSSAPVWIDLDGEMPGQLPAVWTLHPGRLPVRAAWA